MKKIIINAKTSTKNNMMFLIKIVTFVLTIAISVSSSSSSAAAAVVEASSSITNITATTINTTTTTTVTMTKKQQELPKWIYDIHEFRKDLFLKTIEPIVLYLLGPPSPCSASSGSESGIIGYDYHNYEKQTLLSSSSSSSSSSSLSPPLGGYYSSTAATNDGNDYYVPFSSSSSYEQDSNGQRGRRRLTFLPAYVENVDNFRDTSMSLASFSMLFFILGLFLLVFLSCFYHNQKTSPLFISPRRHRLPKLVPPPLPVDSFFSWIKVIFFMADEEIINRIGYDALIFLRFHRLALRCIVKMSFFSFLVLLPLNFMGGGHVNANEYKEYVGKLIFTDFLRFTMANVAGGSPRLWVHCFAAYLLTAIVAKELLVEYNAFSHIRHRYLLSREPHLRTVLVTNIPRHLRTANKITTYFRHVYPEAVKSVTLCQNVIALEKLVAQRTVILTLIERELLLLCRREKKKLVGMTTLESIVLSITSGQPFVDCGLCDGPQERLAKLYTQLEELNDLVEQEQKRRRRVMKRIDRMEADYGSHDIDYILASPFVTDTYNHHNSHLNNANLRQRSQYHHQQDHHHHSHSGAVADAKAGTGTAVVAVGTTSSHAASPTTTNTTNTGDDDDGEDPELGGGVKRKPSMGAPRNPDGSVIKSYEPPKVNTGGGGGGGGGGAGGAGAGSGSGGLLSRPHAIAAAAGAGAVFSSPTSYTSDAEHTRDVDLLSDAFSVSTTSVMMGSKGNGTSSSSPGGGGGGSTVDGSNENGSKGDNDDDDDSNPNAKKKKSSSFRRNKPFLRAKHALRRYSREAFFSKSKNRGIGGGRRGNNHNRGRYSSSGGIGSGGIGGNSIEEHTNEVCDKAFVVMRTFTASTIAMQSMHSAKPGSMHVTTAPEPRDILWENIYMSKGAKRTRSFIGEVFVLLLICFYVVPVALVSLLVSKTALTSFSPRLAQLDRASAFFSSAIGMVQPMCLVGIQQLMPPFLIQLGKAEGHVAFSEVQMRTFSRYFSFQVLNVFLVTAIAGSIFDTLAIVLETPEAAFEMLGNSLPKMSSFFVTYVFMKTFLGLGVELVRAVSLLQGTLRFILFPNSTLRQQRGVRIGMRAIDDPGWFPFHKIMAQDMLVVVIGVVFAVVAPLVLVPCAMFYLCSRILWTHHHLFVFESVFETGGQFWPKVFRRFVFGLLIAQATITGQFIAKEAQQEAIATIILMFLTYFFLRSTRARYDATSSALPLEVATIMDISISQEQETLRKRQQEIVEAAQAAAAAAAAAKASVAGTDSQGRNSNFAAAAAPGPGGGGAAATGATSDVVGHQVVAPLPPPPPPPPAAEDLQLGSSIGQYDPFEHAYVQPVLRASSRARPEQPFPPSQLGREEVFTGQRFASSSSAPGNLHHAHHAQQQQQQHGGGGGRYASSSSPAAAAALAARDSARLGQSATLKLKSLNKQDRELVDRWWHDQLQRAGDQRILPILIGEESGTLLIGKRTNNFVYHDGFYS